MISGNPFHRSQLKESTLELQDILETNFHLPLRIKYSNLKGAHLVASQDIKNGDVVLRECPLALALDDSYLSRYCTFCSAILSTEDKLEYQRKIYIKRSNGGVNEPADGILCMDCSCNNYVIDLHNFPKRQGIQLKNMGSGSNVSLYLIFFRMVLDYAQCRSNTLDDDVIVMDTRSSSMLAYDNADVSIELLNDMFSIASVLQPLVSSISTDQLVQLFRILVCNQHAISAQDGTEIGRAFCPTAALLNHSCDPCLSWSIGPMTNGIMECRAVRDIKLGEELTIAYVNPLTLKQIPTRNARRKLLLDKMHFLCSCVLCRGQCEECGKEECLSKCSKCHATWFCSRECQVNNWKHHKNACQLASCPRLSIE